MNRFATVLFDLDGTLIDHFGAIYRTHSQVREKLGLGVPSFTEVKRAVGGGLENAVERVIGPEHVNLLPQALALYRQLWPANLFFEVSLLPGARELLQALRSQSISTAVLTNKLGDSARALMTHLGVADLLDRVFGANDTPWLKPDRKFTEHVLKHLNASQTTSCLIGDSTYDVLTGKNAGLPIFCVTTGTHTKAELEGAGAAAVYSSLTDLGRTVFGIKEFEKTRSG